MTVAIVAGALANKPRNGGNAWSRLSYVLGLRRLGYDVLLVEEMSEPDAQARDYFRLVCDRFGIDGALLTGQAPHAVVERAGEAAFVLNIGGNLTDPELLSATRRRIGERDRRSPVDTPRFYTAPSALSRQYLGS